VEAWADGPIIKDLYCQFSACGRNPIGKKRARTFVNTAIGGVDFRFKVPPLPTTNIQKFLNTIWETHKHIPQTVLSESTQMPGEPWAVVKQKSRTLKNKPTIPNHLIRDIFQQKISGANQRKNQGSKMTKYKNG